MGDVGIAVVLVQFPGLVGEAVGEVLQGQGRAGELVILDDWQVDQARDSVGQDPRQVRLTRPRSMYQPLSEFSSQICLRGRRPIA
jgi:hypothetical protein